MVGGAAVIAEAYTHVDGILPRASTMNEALVRSHTKNIALDITIGRAGTMEVLRAADLALIASGTATLEAAITETPMVIV